MIKLQFINTLIQCIYNRVSPSQKAILSFKDLNSTKLSYLNSSPKNGIEAGIPFGTGKKEN